MDYKIKYLKYKTKYLALKQIVNQSGGYLIRKEDKEIIEVIHGQTEVKLNTTNDTIKYLQKNNLIKWQKISTFCRFISKKYRESIKTNKKNIKIYLKYFTNIFYIVITGHHREKSRSAEADLTLEKGT